MRISRTRIKVGGLVALACGIVLTPIAFLAILVRVHTSEQRIPFPIDRPISEQDAIEISKAALIRDGKHSPKMRPVSNGHKTLSGKDIYFATSSGDPEAGYVLWWIDDPVSKWQYGVQLSREGDEVLCTITRPL